jgi:hypothetical protein
MTKFLLSILLLFIVNNTIYSQVTQTLRGIVLSKETSAPLNGATIQLHSGANTISSSDGSFVFKALPIRKYTLQVSFIGYKPVILNNLELSSAKELVLTIELEDDIKNLNEVKVESKTSYGRTQNDYLQVSGRAFGVQEANRYAGGYADPARMAMNFAGVTTAGNDQNNEIVIRGNSPKGLLWRLEGVEIPNPNHFADGQGATSGIVSMINANSLANSDFLTGAFPAEYGNASSGVFDLKLRTGNNQKHEQSLTFGLIGLEGTLEGPLNKKGASYYVNYRYSTLELLLKSGLLNIETGGFEPAYRDGNFKISMPTTKAGTFGLFGLWGKSIGDDGQPNPNQPWFKELNTTAIIGLSHKYLTKKGYFYSVLMHSKTLANESELQVIGSTQYTLFENNFTNVTQRLSSYYNHQFSKRLSIRLGGITSKLAYDLTDNRLVPSTLKYNTFLDNSGNTPFYQAYVQAKLKLGNKTTLIGGGHYNHFSLTGFSNLEPRFSVNYSLSNKTSFQLGYGLHSRLEPIGQYFFNRISNGVAQAANPTLQPSLSNHWVLGWTQAIKRNASLKVELYHQALSQVPVDSNRKSYATLLNSSGGLTNTILVNKGKAQNKGMELTLERYFAGNYYFLCTYALFDSKFMAKDGKWRNTIYDNGQAGTLLGGKDWVVGPVKRHWFMLNTKLMWRGGNRYTPINLGESIRLNRQVLYTNKGFEAQYPSFIRLDLGLGYKINRTKTHYRINVDLQNVTNRANVIRENFNAFQKKIEQSTALPIVPVISFRVDF